MCLSISSAGNSEGPLFSRAPSGRSSSGASCQRLFSMSLCKRLLTFTSQRNNPTFPHQLTQHPRGGAAVQGFPVNHRQAPFSAFSNTFHHFFLSCKNPRRRTLQQLVTASGLGSAVCAQATELCSLPTDPTNLEP